MRPVELFMLGGRMGRDEDFAARHLLVDLPEPSTAPADRRGEDFRDQEDAHAGESKAVIPSAISYSANTPRVWVRRLNLSSQRRRPWSPNLSRASLSAISRARAAARDSG